LVSHEGLRYVELVMQDAPSEYISVTDVIVEMTLTRRWPGFQHAHYYPAQIIAHGNAQFKSYNHQEVNIYSLHRKE